MMSGVQSLHLEDAFDDSPQVIVDDTLSLTVLFDRCKVLDKLEGAPYLWHWILINH